MSDRRYRTQRWRRVRAYVLRRDGGVCQVRGPGCVGRATNCRHVLPSSLYPELFWDVENLQAACGPCNRHGGVTAGENRAARMEVAHLERRIEQLQIELEAAYSVLNGLADSYSTGVVPKRRIQQIRSRLTCSRPFGGDISKRAGSWTRPPKKKWSWWTHGACP